MIVCPAAPPVAPQPPTVKEKLSALPPSIARHGDMFQQVSDLLASKDLDAPFTGYAASFDDWKEETEATIDRKSVV